MCRHTSKVRTDGGCRSESLSLLSPVSQVLSDGRQAQAGSTSQARTDDRGELLFALKWLLGASQGRDAVLASIRSQRAHHRLGCGSRCTFPPAEMPPPN